MVLAAPPHPDARERVTPLLVSRILRTLRETFDYVVVDTAPAFDEQTLTALDETDECVIVATLDVPTLKNVKVAVETLDVLNIARDHRHLVLNRADDEVGISADKVEAILGHADRRADRDARSTSPPPPTPASPIVIAQPEPPGQHVLRELAEPLAGEPVAPAVRGARRATARRPTAEREAPSVRGGGRAMSSFATDSPPPARPAATQRPGAGRPRRTPDVHRSDAAARRRPRPSADAAERGQRRADLPRRRPATAGRPSAAPRPARRPPRSRRRAGRSPRRDSPGPASRSSRAACTPAAQAARPAALRRRHGPGRARLPRSAGPRRRARLAGPAAQQQRPGPGHPGDQRRHPGLRPDRALPARPRRLRGHGQRPRQRLAGEVAAG